MKNIFFLFLFAGCSQAGSITGTYVKHVESEYSVGEDTVFIKQVNNQLVLERHTGYQRIVKGKLSDKEIKILHSLITPVGAAYQDTKTGVMLQFQQNTLLFGTAEYQKIQ